MLQYNGEIKKVLIATRHVVRRRVITVHDDSEADNRDPKVHQAAKYPTTPRKVAVTGAVIQSYKFLSIYLCGFEHI